MGSDHYPITISTDQQPQAISRRPRWKYEQADWYQFQESINSKILDPSMNNMDDFLKAVRKLPQLPFRDLQGILVVDPSLGGLLP